jgi:hypothetical protein
MASTTKKGVQKTKSTPRRASLKESNSKLIRENKELRRERDEARQEQSVTSDILRMIAKAPSDLQYVIDAIAQNAARLCHDSRG